MDLRKLAERLADLARRWLASVRSWRARLAVFGVRGAGVNAPNQALASDGPVTTGAKAAVSRSGKRASVDVESSADFGPEPDGSDGDFCSELYGPAPYGAAFASSLGDWGDDPQAVSSRRTARAMHEFDGAEPGDADASDADSLPHAGAEGSTDGMSAWWSGPWWQAGAPYEPLGDDEWSDSSDGELDDDFDWADTPEDLEDVEFELELELGGDNEADDDERQDPFSADAARRGPAFGLPGELSDMQSGDDAASEFDEPSFDPSEDSWQSDLGSSPEDLQSPLAGFYSELDRANAGDEDEAQFGSDEQEADSRDPAELGGWFSADDSEASGGPQPPELPHDDFVDSDERARFADRPPILPSDFLELDWGAFEARLRDDRSS